MNKTELIEHIAKHADISKAAATRALESMIGAVKTTLKKGGNLRSRSRGIDLAGRIPEIIEGSRFEILRVHPREPRSVLDGGAAGEREEAIEDSLLMSVGFGCQGHVRCKPRDAGTKKPPLVAGGSVSEGSVWVMLRRKLAADLPGGQNRELWFYSLDDAGISRE